MTRQEQMIATFAVRYSSDNFERITKKAPTENFTGRKGAKLNKRDRKADREEKREAAKAAPVRSAPKGNHYGS
ncbi:hypothetical protein HOR70_gp07 [Pectobacterium phage PPWS4]|uniref:Uncharacterized protein n=1 Tax=Pectobacterium phage PPWS4 TaxID=1961914 RepID=A0A286P067_9CAUD|nr:hypothetical protein HOR70_gp07 [Pectobacterium phage PPWS4]BBA26422.1 hypothetical protein [Pectobacterium phage PPWS4]